MNFYFEVSAVSRGKGQSLARLMNYISGERLHDSYTGKSFYRKRNDVSFCGVFLPDRAPQHISDLQALCREIDTTEVRRNARTARQFKGSLPNEIPLEENIRIVKEFVETNFTAEGLCAVVAVHTGINEEDPSRNNPHAHILVSTRTIDASGFSCRKDRKHNAHSYITEWRKAWADVQNRAYERNGLPFRVSHESLATQGIHDRIPTIHLSRIDWQKERRGERTMAGDLKRMIDIHNKKRSQSHFREKARALETSRD